MKNSKDKKLTAQSNKYAAILKYLLISTLIAILLASLILFIILLGFNNNSGHITSLSGYHCFSQMFICSQNVNYSPTGQISLNLRQKVTYPEIYNVSFLCTSYNSTIASFTKFGSSVLNTTNSTMPYNVTVRASDIQCYNSTGPVHLSPNTTFKGALFANFYTKNGTRNVVDAVAITIIRKG